MHNWSHADAFLYLFKPDIHAASLQYLERRVATELYLALSSNFLVENDNEFNFSQQGIIQPYFLGKKSNERRSYKLENT